MSVTSPRLLRVIAGAAIIAAGLALSGCSSIIGALTGEDDVFSVEVGDCLNDADVSGEVQTVPIVDCAEPHDSEAYHSHLLPDGDYPGEQAISDAASDACLDEFETFVGLHYDDSMLDATYYSPTTESWANGDREILCIVYDPAGQMTGSLAGAQR